MINIYHPGQPAQAIPLQPKAIHSYRPIWRRIRDNGFDVIPLRGRDGPFRGWPWEPNTDEAISHWQGKAAGIRMFHSSAFVIDLDVRSDAVREALLEGLSRCWPQFMADCLRRSSGSTTLALIGQVSTARKRHWTARFKADGPKPHLVEYFTGNDKRYVGVHGYHSEGREYGYIGKRTILNTRLDQLPWFPEADIPAMITECERVMAGLGLEQIVIAQTHMPGERVYDLKPDDVLMLSDGERIRLDELEKRAGTSKIKAFANIWDPNSKTRDRVLVNRSGGAGLTLWDTKTGVSHRWKHLASGEEFGIAPAIARISGHIQTSLGGVTMQQKISPRPNRPGTKDPLIDKVTWLVMTHGFDPRANRVIMLYEPSAQCAMTLEAFKTLYKPWWEEEPHKEKGKPVVRYATNIWEMHPTRAEIAGVRMRPDKAFPGYRGEDGHDYKNSYRQPVHVDDGSGEVQTFLDFLDRFIPAADESDFWLEWMAHKLRHPEVPGTSVWFVANDEDGPREGKFGTGRGLMFRILHALYGEAYCKSEDFDILAGTSAQAVYTDWQANCVLVTVDEAHVSPTAYRRGEKRSVYTALKNCIDPAAKRRSFKIKGGQTFDGTSFCSVVVATNHANAAAIPENDRRISVLRNGQEMTPEEAVAIDAWMKKPANIAALAGYLAKIDLTSFNMYQPLKTEAKAQMAEQALSYMDEILEDFAEDDEMGLVFTRPFLEQAVERHLSGGGERTGAGGREWRGQFAGAFDEHCAPVRSTGSVKPRIRVNGQRYRLYCFRARSKAAAQLNETERRAEASKWGSIDSIQTILREVKPGQ